MQSFGAGPGEQGTAQRYGRIDACESKAPVHEADKKRETQSDPASTYTHAALQLCKKLATGSRALQTLADYPARKVWYGTLYLGGRGSGA